MTLADEFADGLSVMGLDLPARAQAQLLEFLSLLAKWNRTFNLTAIRDEAAMLRHHVLDSLAVIPALGTSAFAGRHWADVGSGAGLPGIPLAVACPELRLTSIEAVEKKASFQRQAKIALQLENFTVEQQRVEGLAAGRFDAVISRAFAELSDFIRLAGHLLAPGGRLYAMKGIRPDHEISAIPHGWRLAGIQSLAVPLLDAERHLLVIEKA